MKQPVKVCVTGVGGGSIGEQVVKALRAAQEEYSIIGTDISDYSAGRPMVDGYYVVPRAQSPDYLAVLEQVCVENNVQVLIPGSEAELQVISDRRDKFAQLGIFVPINPKPVIDTCLNKVETFTKLTSLGFDVPWFLRVTAIEQVANFSRFPLVFKPSSGAGGSVDTVIVQNAEEACLFARYLLGIYSEFIAQEYIGVPEAEYTVGVLSDMDGNLLNSIVIHRNLQLAMSRRLRVPNRTGRQELGSSLVISSGISQGAIGRFPEIAACCEQISQAIGAKGPLNIQCRFFDNKVWVFEINPRFSGTTSLRALAGFNEPDCLIKKHVRKETVLPRFAYKTGVALRRLEECFFNADT